MGRLKSTDIDIVPNYLLQKAAKTSKNRQKQTKVGIAPKIKTNRSNSTRSDINRHVPTNIDKYRHST